jgi:hypothetical protein
MAHLQTQMAELHARPDLSAQEKRKMLSGKQCRFDKLKQDIGVVSGGPAPPAAIAALNPRELLILITTNERMRLMKMKMKKARWMRWKAVNKNSMAYHFPLLPC